jgi:hypothetical protein
MGASDGATLQAPAAHDSKGSSIPRRAAEASSTDSSFLPQVPPRAWNAIVLHHSGTSVGDVASIDAVHRQQRDENGRPWLGIGYHFVIGNGRKMGDGEIQPTFRWREQLPGAHAGKRAYNEHGIGICLIGNFDEHAPTSQQVAAARKLVKLLAERYAIGRAHVVRHGDVQATACPGRWFCWEQIQQDLPPPGGSSTSVSKRRQAAN